MPQRRTLQFWICWCKTQNPPEAKSCINCSASRIERHAQVNASERAVVYVNPLTGERRTPARADQPLPEVYRSRGFERQEILSMSRYEREPGTVHESSTFHPGNEESSYAPPPRKEMPSEAKRELISSVRDALASGPMTTSEGSSSFSVLPSLKP